MKRTYYILLALWALVWLFFAYGALMIPAEAQVPIHWNAQFEVDDWAGKWTALAIGPAVCTLIPILFWLVPILEPRRKHLRDSMKTLSIVIVSVQILMTLMYVYMVLIGTGLMVNLPIMVIFGIGILFMVIGNYLGKVRSNFMLGIRTPWTLSSETVWNKTHRLGGKLFVVLGLTIMLLGPIGATWSLYVFLAGVFLTVGGTTVYSWWIFRKEQNQLLGMNQENGDE